MKIQPSNPALTASVPRKSTNVEAPNSKPLRVHVVMCLPLGDTCIPLVSRQCLQRASISVLTEARVKSRTLNAALVFAELSASTPAAKTLVRNLDNLLLEKLGKSRYDAFANWAAGARKFVAAMEGILKDVCGCLTAWLSNHKILVGATGGAALGMTAIYHKTALAAAKIAVPYIAAPFAGQGVAMGIGAVVPGPAGTVAGMIAGAILPFFSITPPTLMAIGVGGGLVWAGKKAVNYVKRPSTEGSDPV